MEARPALSFQRSDSRQLSSHATSGALSSSLSVLSTSLEEKYSKLPDYQEVSMKREPMSSPRPQLSSNSGAVGHIFSSSAGFSTDLHFSSASLHEKHSRKAPFISQTSNAGTSMPLHHSSHSGVLQSTASSHYTTENNNDSWCTDSLPGFLNYHVNTPAENNQIDCSNNSCVMPSEDFSKPSDWQEWADQLITDDDALPSNWDDLLVDTGVVGSEPQVGHSSSK